jgi:hypothetical protein
MIPRGSTPHVGQARRASLGLATCLLLGACSALVPADTPGGVVVGSWGGSDATLTADRGGATLSIPCIGARFPALRLDDSLGFQSTGVITQAGGAVTVRVGDPFVLTGRLLGNRVVIPFPWIVPGPGADTLRSGTDSVHVCNA